MRGNPLIRLVVAVAVFLLLGVPVWRLTEGEEAPRVILPTAETDAPVGTDAAFLYVKFDFEEAPSSLVMTLNGRQQSFLLPDNPSGEWEVGMTKDGADIQVEATWATQKKHALGIRITTAGFPVAEKTFWSDAHGEIHDVISLVP